MKLPRLRIETKHRSYYVRESMAELTETMQRGGAGVVYIGCRLHWDGRYVAIKQAEILSFSDEGRRRAKRGTAA